MDGLLDALNGVEHADPRSFEACGICIKTHAKTTISYRLLPLGEPSVAK